MDNAYSRSFSRKLFNLLILLLFLIACGLPNSRAAPITSPPLTDHILVSLTEPLDGEAYPISAGLSIRGEAISDGSIARMELWADGEMYEEYTAPEDGLGLLVHYWTWSPTTLGKHTLMVRAHNDQNQSAFSSVVTIEGIPDPGYVLITKVEEGDTIPGIAEKYNVSVEDILNWNPSLRDAVSLMPGTEIFIHVGAPAASSVPSTTAKVLMKLSEWSANAELTPPGSPSAPGLTVTGQGCTAKLAINDYSTNEQGFNIYRLDPGAISFKKLTSLPAHEGVDALSHTDTNLYGAYHYYVAAFDEGGEAASNLVGLMITDSNCAGTPTTIDDLALVPMSVDQYYLYVSINNGNWRRFPADEFTYVKRSDNIDFGQVASALAPNLVGSISLRGEVWGMVNGRATLLGTFDKSLKPGQAPAVLEPASIQNILLTTLEVRGVYDTSKGKYLWLKEKGTLYTPEIFRFGTDTGAAYGIWQVASVPFDKGASFNPACLLLAGKAKGSGTPSSPFEFGIDFSQLKPKIETVQLSPFENSFSQTPVFISPFSPQKFDASPQQAVNQPKWGAGAFGLGGSPVVANFDPCALNVSAEGAVIYYVRIIPMDNGQSVGNASNTVKMIYDPNSQIKITFPAPPPIPGGTYYDVKILNFTGVHVPDLKYEFCVVVVENKSPQGSPWVGFKPGTVLCPETFKGGNDNDILGAIEDAVNFISDLYTKLSDWATELVDKLNPLCIQAKLVSSAVKVGEKEVKDACHYIAVIAVTAAKTYVGLPPSLPNFDQLVNMGKDNLVELAAQELEANGVPCPEDCKKVIRQGIDYSIEQVKNSMTNSSCMGEDEAHQNGVEPLCFPSGVITKPDPRGQPAPAVVEVEVTRRPGTTGPDFPEPVACSANIKGYANNDSHIGHQFSTIAGFTWQGAPIEGDLLYGSAAFPNLQPGASTKLPIALSPVSFWLDGHKSFVNKGYKPENYDDWGILYEGAMATLTADGDCKFVFPEGTGITSDSVEGDTRQEGPLGDAWNQTCHPYNCP